MPKRKLFSSRNAMIYALFIGTGIFACADTITIGSDTSLNVYPFNADLYAGEYQQVYSASAFSGLVEITAITFFSIPDALSNSISGDFTIDLSTTSAGVGSLSTTYANNIGANNAQFFNGVVISATSFDGAPFLYDPSQGNLLMDVQVNGPLCPPCGGDFFAGPSTDTDRVFNLGGNGAATAGFLTTPGGLKTMFTVTPVGTTIPEPSSLSLLLLGIGAFGLVREVKRRAFLCRRVSTLQ